jgi:drug/metabolite transporter (DMT)-like permease
VREAIGRFWERNRGVVLVAVAQLFGALMNLAARLLELEAGMHPLQILFVRMSMTTVLSCLYMWWNKVPDFPLGAKGIRGVLVVRGVSGFVSATLSCCWPRLYINPISRQTPTNSPQFGIYGMWYSMMYLPLAEATVITFLAPMLAGYICHVLLKDPFTRREQLASLLALAGVVLIARPTSLFGTTTPDPTPNPSPQDQTNSTTTPTPHSSATTSDDDVPPTQRLLAILVALLGVLGAAGAYTTIRYIGKRAHALITVTYFSVWSTLVSTTALLLFPLLGIGQAEPPIISFAGLLPGSAYEWFLLVALGLCGFVMQFMLTSGIGGERSNRATAMVYTHMLFAAGFDRWVFGHRMGVVSVVGCGLVVGSAVWAALRRKVGGDGEGRKEVGGGDVERGSGSGRGEEGVPMLTESGGEEDEDERRREEGGNGGPRRGG